MIAQTTLSKAAPRRRTPKQACRPAGLLVLGLMFLIAACSRAGEKVPDGWQGHRDPLGFYVAYPADWSVDAGADGSIRIASPDGRRFAMIQPFYLQRPERATGIIRQLPGLYPDLLRGARIEESRTVRDRPDEAIARLRFRQDGTWSRASVLCSIDGRSGMLYILAADEDDYEATRDDLLGVLQSFRFEEPKQPAAKRRKADSVDYVRWQDPIEQAFWLEVPRGWKVSGGTFRYASVDVRPQLIAESPDGAIRITSGDVEIPPYIVPTPMLQMTGFSEGSVYSPGYGVQMMVMRYMPGMDFARWYVEFRVAGMYEGVRVTHARPRPDLVQSLNDVLYRYGALGIGASMQAGEVAFTGRLGGNEMRGYYLAVTQLTSAQGGGIWNVQHLIGYVAEAGREQEAQDILGHMIRSSQMNPQWAAMQSQLAGQTAAIVSDTHQQISAIIDEGYWGRQAGPDEAMRNWSNMMLGQTDVRDPEDGSTWKVASGRNYYWRRAGSDTVVGTDTYDRPDIDFTPLNEW